MTREELDQQIVEKKFAQLSVADSTAILHSFNAQGICIPANIGSRADRLLQLNLAKKITQLPEGMKLESSLGYFLKLTNFGVLMRRKLETNLEPKCPF